MKEKILYLIFAFNFCFFVGLVNVKASTLDERMIINNGKKVSFASVKNEMCQIDVGKVIFENPLKINDINIELYCSFENNDEAREEAMYKYKKGFDYLYDNYDLPEQINENNWQSIKNIIIEASDNERLDKDVAFYLRKILGFFDIYENKQINDEIKLLANQLIVSSLGKNLRQTNEIKNRLDEIIPDYSENFNTITSIFNSNQRVGSSLNVARATDYAETYARTSNPEYYYFNGADCTNFVSQILEYSGVRQVSSSSVYSGWWHKYSNGVHTHSHSWTVANVFARYMGVTVSTKDIYSWSKDLREGDFIAYDKKNDGSWDHMAYVTDTSGVLKTYTWTTDNYSGMVNYYNFRVAQHTKDYLEWVSNSKNGWETLVEDGAKFGRIRG